MVVCADGKKSDVAAYELIKYRIDAIVLNGGILSVPVADNVPVKDEKEIEVSAEEVAEKNTKLSGAEEDGSPDLFQENRRLTEDNQRLRVELDRFKKQYRLLYKQTEKLKAALDKLRARQSNEQD